MKLKFKKIKDFILYLVSFGTPQAIVVNLVSAIILLIITPTPGLKYAPFKSVNNFLLKLFFGENCPLSGIFANCESPSTGLTRATSRLLHGDLAGALEFNRAVLIVFGVVVVLILINLVKWIRYYEKTGKVL